MVNTFGILAALVLAFSAFVAFKNKEEFEKQKIATEAEQARKEVNSKTLAGLVASIKQLTADKDAANKARDEYTKQFEDQLTKNKAVQTEITTKEGELASAEAAVADAKEKLKELGPLEELAGKIDRLGASIKELEDQITVLNTQIDLGRGQKARTAEALAAAKKKLSDINSGRSLASMKTRISSIDRRLGIVTLGAGIRSGVVGGSRVAVMRGGEKIGELNVQAVSANLATADVVRSTLKEGEEVAPGDTVVPIESIEKKEEEKKAANAAASKS